MNWNELSEESQLYSIVKLSFEQPVIIFKHSTRCSISSMAKMRLDKADAPAGTSFYYLDLIRHRNISNKIAEDFKVHHESPQVLIIRQGECVYDESHNGISIEDIAQHI